MTEGRKDDTGKLPWSLIPWGPMRDVVKVLDFGARKYGAGNWKNVPDARSRYFSAAMRHILAWWDGEEADSETGISHLAHAACCLIFLMWMDKDKGQDDV